MDKQKLKQKIDFLIKLNSKKWLCNQLGVTYATLDVWYNQMSEMRVKHIELINKLYDDEISVL